jgi:hypothetical protein
MVSRAKRIRVPPGLPAIVATRARRRYSCEERMRLRARICCVLVGAMAAPIAISQGFNIDLDETTSGNWSGAPSISFGGAVGQGGHWNRIDETERGPVSLRTLDGSITDVFFSLYSQLGPVFGVATSVTGNTGDYALLLNDAAEVGTVVQGGTLEYTFEGLSVGEYDVVTYAVSPRGGSTPTAVTVVGSSTANPQVVTGPMPGNGFTLGITHSVHRLSLSPGAALSIVVHQPPGIQLPFPVNGFQIVPVPESPSRLGMLGGLMLIFLRKKSACMPQPALGLRPPQPFTIS